MKLFGEDVNEESQNQSKLMMFLEDSCAKSPFDEEYILISDLQEWYEHWLEQKGFNETSEIVVKNSPKMTEFGATYSDNVQVSYIFGIRYVSWKN